MKIEYYGCGLAQIFLGNGLYLFGAELLHALAEVVGFIQTKAIKFVDRGVGGAVGVGLFV